MPSTLLSYLIVVAVLAVASLWILRAPVEAIILKIDSRGWLAIACWLLVVVVLLLVASNADLRKDDLFKMLAQGLVLTAFVGLVLAFYFSASKGDATNPPAQLPPAPPADTPPSGT